MKPWRGGRRRAQRAPKMSSPTKKAARSAAALAALAALHAAAQRDDCVQLKAELVGGKRIDSVDVTGNTMLHAAAGSGAMGAVRLLIQAGAPVDAKGPDLRTPLHDAAAGGHGLVIEALLLSGADHSCFDAMGRTPRLSALHAGQDRMARMLDDSKVAVLHRRHREAQRRDALQTLAGGSGAGTSRVADQTVARLAFSVADHDGDGALSGHEVQSVLASHGLRSDGAFVEALMTKYDTDRSGSIELSEFDRLLSLLAGNTEGDSSPRGGGVAVGRPLASQYARITTPSPSLVRTDGQLGDIPILATEKDTQDLSAKREYLLRVALHAAESPNSIPTGFHRNWWRNAQNRPNTTSINVCEFLR